MATLAALDGGSGAARAQHCAAAPSAGSVRSAAFVRRASPEGREGGRSGHVAPPLQSSATTSASGKRLRWNSCCSSTRWITAPSPRPAVQPSTVDTTTTTTTAPMTLGKRGTLRHEDTPFPNGTDDPLQHPPLAPPIQAAQQAAVWILVAAQYDIARRDRVINTMRARWWRQLYSYAIHLTETQARQRHLQALRQVSWKTQQLAAEELQLEKTAMAADIEKLNAQLEDWRREQAERVEAQKIEEQRRAAQRAKEERRLKKEFQEYLTNGCFEQRTGGICEDRSCRLPKPHHGACGSFPRGTFYSSRVCDKDYCAECMLRRYEDNGHEWGEPRTAPTSLRDQAEELERLRGELHPSVSEESAPSQPSAEASTAAVHLLSTQLTEAERQWKTWQDKATQLERQLEATEQKHGATAVHCRQWQHMASDLEQQLKAMQQEFDQELAFGSELQFKFKQEQQYVVKLQQDAANFIQELRRLEHNGVQVDWHRL